jgi:hypothetical protein
MKLVPITKPKDRPLSYLYTATCVVLTPVALLIVTGRAVAGALCEVYLDNRDYFREVYMAPGQYREREAVRRARRERIREKDI